MFAILKREVKAYFQTAVIPSQSSYMIHINAMENRISQKFTLRIPFKKSQIKNTVNKTLNALISAGNRVWN